MTFVTMLKNIKWWSVRTKIFLVFFCFILFSGILLGITNFFHTEKTALNKRLTRLTEFESAVNKAAYYQNQVFLNDFTHPQFYRKENTYNLVSYQNSYNQSVKLLKKIKTPGIKKDPVMKNYYHDCKAELKKVDYYFKKIIALQKIRGFRDEGMEGRMRAYAHQLESSLTGDRHKVQLLQLRRHEKDYFLRGDPLYAEKLRLEAGTLSATVPASDTAVLDCIDAYVNCFDSIKNIDNLTGLKTRGGYNNMLTIYTLQLHSSVGELYSRYKNYYALTLNKIDNLNVFATIVLLMIAAIMGLIISSSITVRVRSLSDFMNKYVDSRFKIRSRFDPAQPRDEIGQLVKNFEVLENEITVQFEKYKLKVGMRTEEILKQKNEIEKQKSIIEEKNEELTRQKNVLNFQNQHILESLKSAKELQKSFFPGNEKLENILGNFYLRFAPLDIVSGDFYWVEQTENGTYIAIADCTGHGAHGALMSINGINLLNHALKTRKLVHPFEILNFLSSEIHQQFYTGDSYTRHSMDIALVQVTGNQLFFAGAQRDVLIVKNDEVTQLLGDRRPLGWSNNGLLYNFTGQLITLDPDDRVIMYTDGLTDQFGGITNKKFKKGHFIDLVRQSAHLSAGELFDVISGSFDNWKSDAEQTDDVSLLVFTNHIQQQAFKSASLHKYAKAPYPLAG